MKLAKTRISALLIVSFAFISCRGQISDKPPVHPNPNMDFQERFNAQEENPFFADGRSMRTPVEGTIARGNLRNNTAYYEGVDDNEDFIEEIPVELTRSFLERGKERYDIFCTPCHGGTGDGRGIIMTGQYGYVPAPSFHRDVSYEMPVGEFYSAISNGIRNMPSYASQIPVEDRWAIVAYIRALQRSQNVSEEEMEQFDVDLAELHNVYEAEQERLQTLEEARSGGGDEEPTAERGESVFVQNACQACHSTDGTRLVGPSFQNLFGSERTFEDGTTLTADEDYLRESIQDPSAKIVEGYLNAMVPYDYLSDSDIESLIEYIKSLSDQ